MVNTNTEYSMAKNVVLRDLAKVSCSYQMEESGDITDSVRYWSKDEPSYLIKDLVWKAHNVHESWRPLRDEYARCTDFTYGNQWRDKITVYDECGHKVTMTEEEYLQREGMIPLQNNLIRRLVRNIVGVFRNQDKEVTCRARDRKEQMFNEGLTTLLQRCNQANNMDLKNARSCEKGVIGGFACYATTYGWKDHRLDCWVEPVSIYDISGDTNASDYSGKDFSMIVRLHQLSISKICATWAKSPTDIKLIKEEYKVADRDKFLEYQYRRFGIKRDSHNDDFFLSDDPNLCRVIEIWTKETRTMYHCHDWATGELFDVREQDRKTLVDAENKIRIKEGLAAGMRKENIALIQCDDNDWFIDEYWYVRYCTPYGHVLQEGESPYEHGEHPYTFFLYPFVEGEIHSYVHDVIPQQKLINRSTVEQDYIIRASSKGALLYDPRSFEDEDMSEIARQWANPRGMIPYKSNPNISKPEQIGGVASMPGLMDQLSNQMKIFEDESGVSGALQGKPGYSTTSGTLYAQQTQNSTNSLIDFFGSLSSFITETAYKMIKVILQYYDDEKIEQIVGETAQGMIHNALHIRDIDFDVAVVESTNSPVYRAITNDYLTQLWQAGQITAEQLLEHGDFPFADALLQDMRARAEQAAALPSPSGESEGTAAGRPYMTMQDKEAMRGK